MPTLRQYAETSRRLAMLTGWPPARFTVTPMVMYGMRSAPDLSHESLDLGEIDIALEGMLGGRIVSLVDDDIAERAAGELLVQARRGEVHVAGQRSRHP